jgi:hypothetical protein
VENKNQMQAGTWEKMSKEDYSAANKVKFEINITQKVILLNPVPKESVGEDGGIYYVFDVEQDKVPKIIQTSAWTLLKELKKIELKAGTILEITKKLKAGKQFFEVKEIK